MINRTCAHLARLAVVIGAAIVGVGCNTGGLLLAEKTSVDPPGSRGRRRPSW